MINHKRRIQSSGVSAARGSPTTETKGLILSQPLLDHPELDAWLQHPGAYPLIEAVLGGSDAVRWSEFNFREAPAGAGPGQMNFHHDAVMADRFTRTPYGPCDWVCSIHYLTDVDTASPAFCVVPGTHRFESLQDAYETLGDAYVEIPIYGEAGTAIIYDTAIYHTRLDGTGTKGRRTWHQYYARGGFCPCRCSVFRVVFRVVFVFRVRVSCRVSVSVFRVRVVSSGRCER